MRAHFAFSFMVHVCECRSERQEACETEWIMYTSLQENVLNRGRY